MTDKKRGRGGLQPGRTIAIDTPKREVFVVTPWTDQKRTDFLNALREVPNVGAACRRVHCSRTTVYNLRKEDPTFAAEWDEAIEDGLDELESVAASRAIDKSDLLMIFLLKGYRPEKFRERMDVTSAGQPMQPRITEIVINLPVPGEVADERVQPPEPVEHTPAIPAPIDEPEADA